MFKITHKLKIGILIFIAAIILAGCEGTPKGTDPDVKALVIEIAQDELRDQLAPLIYQKVTNVPAALLGLEITYDALVEYKDEDRNAEVLAELNATMEQVSMTLENIRTDSIDDKIKKSQSSADLIVNGESHPITFTAQYSEDGFLYVEVFGLD